MGGCGCGSHGASRRDVLRWGAATAGFLALGPFRGVLPVAKGAPLGIKRLVVVNLFGGNDTTNMVIPVKLAPYYTRRPTLAIAEADALPLGGPGATADYRLHPALPRLKALWDLGKVAAVNRVGYPRANLSHFTSQDIFSLGVRDGFADLGVPQSGWIARFADAFAPTPMGAVSLGVGRPLDFEGGSSSPLLANDLASFRITVNAGSAAQLHRLEAAKEILGDWQGAGSEGEARRALSLAYELADQIQDALAGYASTVVYSTAAISRRLKDVAVLIQGGFETRVFFTGFGGFDTHGAQGTSAGAQAALFTALDDGVASLAQDLMDMGAWDDTLILVLTEFGRRNYENGSAGTDHGHAFCELAIGGAVKGGMVGPGLVDADLMAEYPSYEVDFRSIYMEILQKHLGADPATVFPEPLEKSVTLGLV